MKKLLAFALVLCIMFLANVATAESAKVVLAGSNNRFAGPRDLKELDEFSAKPERASRSNEVGGLGLYGPVLRAKAMVKAVDRSYSMVDFDIVEIYDELLLDDLEISKTAADILTATLVNTNDCVGHRFVCPDAPSYPVAMLETDGSPVIVVSFDWDEDGLEELCLVAGSKASTGYDIPDTNGNGNNQNNGNNNTQDGDGNQNDGDNGTQDGDGDQNGGNGDQNDSDNDQGNGNGGQGDDDQGNGNAPNPELRPRN